MPGINMRRDWTTPSRRLHLPDARTASGAARGRLALAKPDPDARYNLLIVHNRTFQALDGWQEIAARMARQAPDIEVRILSEDLPQDLLTRPSLVVSPRPIEATRGRAA